MSGSTPTCWPSSGRETDPYPAAIRLRGPAAAVCLRHLFPYLPGHSGPVREVLASNWSRLVIPSLAVTEVCHLLADPQRRWRVGLAAEFCAAIADDELRVIEVTPHDYRRMAELLTTYSSLRLQVVDASVIALAKRLDLHEVAALDRRDFQVIAPRHLPKGQRLKLLPED